jgi:ubiquinone/menaquinone biosynthesis C-methylase UbiE/uncharacterized protein YbaR (Trm112 family)
MHVDAIGLLRCPNCQQNFLSSRNETQLRIFSDQRDALGHRVNDGAVFCSRCGMWFRIENGVIDLLPADVQDGKTRQAFAERFGLENGYPKMGADPRSREHKMTQQEFFSRHLEEYERDVVQSSFYQALDMITVHKWIDRLHAGSKVVDIGAGSSRTVIPLAGRGHRVFAVDVSEPIVNFGQEKVRAVGVEANVEFVLGDAEALPFLNASVDAALCHGTLHHLEAPERAIAEVGRILKPGGDWFSLDPNKSPVRWVFDLAMKVKRLWHEEASGHPLQTEESLLAWCADAGIEAEVEYTCYVLPHFLSRLKPTRARSCLEFTDGLFSRVRILARWGGVIYVVGKKSGRLAEEA